MNVSWLRPLLGFTMLLVGLSFLYLPCSFSAEQGQQEKEMAALKTVMPEAERFEAAKSQGAPYWVAYRGSERIGGVFKTEGSGYAGTLRVMTGIDNEGKVSGIVLVSHNETPALVSQTAIQEFLSQFVGKKPSFTLKKDDPSGNIDAIASATVSCRAIMSAVGEAFKIFKREWTSSKGTE